MNEPPAAVGDDRPSSRFWRLLVYGFLLVAAWIWPACVWTPLTFNGSMTFASDAFFWALGLSTLPLFVVLPLIAALPLRRRTKGIGMICFALPTLLWAMSIVQRIIQG